MSKETFKKTPLALAMGTAFTVSLTATTAVNAENNPFGMTDLSSGYMVALKENPEGSCGEGKCGEGKCGDEKSADDDKGEEGKCGEGKCGEGKCGGEKSADDDKGEEGKCGEGKCGGSK